MSRYQKERPEQFLASSPLRVILVANLQPCTFSSNALGDFRGLVRDDSAGMSSNLLSTPIIAFQNNGFREVYFKGTLAIHHGNQEWKTDIESDSTFLNQFADDDQLLDTEVSFPIAFRKAKLYGAESKLELPRWGRFSGFASYSYMVGSAYLPVTGGLFLGDDARAALNQSSGRLWVT